MPREPALLTSAGRMPERSQHRVSEGQGARSERPATGRGRPRTRHIDAWPRSVRSEVIAISPNCRGGTRHSRGLCSSTLTAPA